MKILKHIVTVATGSASACYQLQFRADNYSMKAGTYIDISTIVY